MKTFAYKFGTLAIAFTMLAGLSNAQPKKYLSDPKYGPDSTAREECAMRMSLYNEFYKQKNYKDAYNDWRKVFINCPAASKNTFIRGAVIIKNLINAETNVARKQALIDTLMYVYDQRITYFKQEGLVLASKGLDLYTYRGESVADDVYKMLKHSCELQKGATNAGVVSIFMRSVVDLYRAEKIDAAEVISAYELSMATVDAAIAETKVAAESGDPKKAPAAQKELENFGKDVENVEALFSESGAASCEALVQIFGAQYDARKDDVDWLKKVTKLLDKTDCNADPLFAQASEALYALEPSAVAARNLARLFLIKQEWAKAGDYYSKACELQEDVNDKSVYYYEWSQVVFAQKQYQKVRELARKAIEFNPNNGKAYIAIGKAYASDAQNIGEEQVEHNAAYWAAVDKFVKAKQVDESCASEANDLIATYSKHFPNKEEAFMFGMKVGDRYTVKGWINETTTVRF